MESMEDFVSIYRNRITRHGSAEMLDWLLKSTFFDDPASTRFHNSFRGGLCSHSTNVCKRLDQLVSATLPLEQRPSPETVAIVSLLHDCAKIGTYCTEFRNRKNEFGQWEKYPVYVFDDPFPMGHGEKSLYIVSSFMKLSREEAMAIRWHMGFADAAFKGGDHSISKAFEKYPLAVLLHEADMLATYLDEQRGPQ